MGAGHVFEGAERPPERDAIDVFATGTTESRTTPEPSHHDHIDVFTAGTTESRTTPEPSHHDHIEVFATGTTEWRSRPGASTDDEIRHALAGQIHRTGEAVRDAVRQARAFHARPGHRPGQTTPATASSRRGSGTDVVRPVLVDPRQAYDLAVSGSLFERPLRHLVVEHPGDRAALTWDVVITTGRRRRHPATLCLLASPSMVVTVIELVPNRRVRRNRDGFVSQGIAALDELARRLEAARSPSAA